MNNITFEDLLNKKSTKGTSGSKIETDKYPIVVAISTPKNRKAPMVTMYFDASVKWNNGSKGFPTSLKVVFYEETEDLYILPVDGENLVQRYKNGSTNFITPNSKTFLGFASKGISRIGFTYKRDVPGAINFNLKEGVIIK